MSVSTYIETLEADPGRLTGRTMRELWDEFWLLAQCRDDEADWEWEGLSFAVSGAADDLVLASFYRDFAPNSDEQEYFGFEGRLPRETVERISVTGHPPGAQTKPDPSLLSSSAFRDAVLAFLAGPIGDVIPTDVKVQEGPV